MSGGAAAGGIANGILFFMFLIGSVIVGLYVAAYAAHSFLTVIESTAAGTDEVRWPDEPYVDWAWKVVYVAWLVAVWMVPVLFLARWWASSVPASQAFGRMLLVVAVLFWLLFPISLLSSMSAASRWTIFSPALLPRLAKRSGSVLAFYLLTAPVLALGALGAYGLVAYEALWALPLGAVALAIALLLDGRLLGRLALVLRHAEPRPVRRKPTAKRRESVQVRAAAHDPWADTGAVIAAADLPPVNAPDPEARVGYDVRLDSGPSAAPAADPPRRRPAHFEEVIPYDLGDGEAGAPPRGPMPEQWSRPPEQEMAFARSGRPLPPPESPWTSGLIEFPFYMESRRALVWLSLGLAGFGFLVRMTLANSFG